jgi:hypothetical protein
LRVKGKRETVPVYRLLSVGGTPARRHDSPFVGRGEALERVREALERVVEEKRCELVTVVGEPGVGKVATGRGAVVIRRGAGFSWTVPALR